MKHYLLTCFAMLYSMAGIASDWLAPEPATTPLVKGETFYFYNAEAGRFIHYGNQWGAEVSLSEKEALQMQVLDATTTALAKYVNGSDAAEAVVLKNVTHQRYFAFVREWNGDTFTWYDRKPAEATELSLFRLQVLDGGAFQFGLTNTQLAAWGYPEGLWSGWTGNAGDTRVRTIINPADYPSASCTWHAVTPAAYEVFFARKSLYSQLLVAEANKVSTAGAGAVYNNPEATKAEVEAATEQLKADIEYALAHPDDNGRELDPEKPELVLWASPQGNAEAAGTAQAPLSLMGAVERVRQTREAGQAARIVLTDGIYRLQQTLVLTADDSFTTFEAAPGAKPMLSGGEEVNDWAEAGHVDGLPEVAQGQIWVAQTPQTADGNARFRQMWVGQTKARRASTLDDLSLPRLISVDKAAKTLTVPRLSDQLLGAEGLEMTIIQDWAVNIMRVKGISNPNDYRSVLTFDDEEGEIEFKRPWPILRADENSFSNHFFYLSGALQLLNRPQEWHNDAKNGRLYYWPRQGETMEETVATVPVLEQLVCVSGAASDMALGITFRGIGFEHTTWMRPSEKGHVPLQAGQWLYDAYSVDNYVANNKAWVGRPGSAVSLSYVKDASFEGCTFQHIGSTALDCVEGTRQVSVNGCVFNDVAGNAILGGYFGDEQFESHLPWNPLDLKVVCDGLSITNNYIAHPANEDWGCLAVCVGFASNVTIAHNEIFDTPYSAISMGWGWTKEENCMHDNHITGNYIHSFSNQMRDGAAIYTLSAQPNSSITGNRIEEVGDPLLNPIMWDMKTAQFDIYLDEGSSYFTVKDNWCEQGSVNKNQNGPGNSFGTNSTSVSASIKNAAGLESAYQAIRLLADEASYAPLDTLICEPCDLTQPLDFIAPCEGMKLGCAVGVDLNGDGRLDIAYTGGESHQVQHGGVRINKGGLDFAASQSLPRLNLGNLASGDVNGDGSIDLVQAGWGFWDCQNYLLLNDGNGHLAKQRLNTSLNTSPACGIADVNGDGLCDLFFVGNGTDNAFYLQQPDRTFGQASSLLKGLPGGFSDPSMVWADLNNDQSVDLVLLSNRTGGIYTRAWLNDGKGNFTERNMGITEKGTRGSMACGDVNGDGLMDIVVLGYLKGEAWNWTAAQGGKTATLYFGNGDGTFTKHQDFAEYLGDNTGRTLALGDYDGDGTLDLVLTGWNYSKDVSCADVWLNDGHGNFTLAGDLQLPGVSEGSVTMGDFCGTGRLDLLLTGNHKWGYEGFSGDRRLAVLQPNTIAKTNTAPQAPDGLTVTVGEGGKVNFRWNAATDQETPSQSLTYNIYVRDLSTGLFVVSPDANLLTGQRHVAQMGNAYLNLGWTLTLPDGDYEWSVQTIDAGYMGSAFAPVRTFSVPQKTVGTCTATRYPDSATLTMTKEELQQWQAEGNQLLFVDGQIGEELPANVVTKNASNEWTAKTVNLTDGAAFYCPENVQADTVNYLRTFASQDWQAMFIPFELQEADWTGKAEMAYIGNVHQYDDHKDGSPDRTMLEFYTVQGGRLRPNVPYIVKPNATGETAFTATNTTLKATPATDAYVDCSSTTHLYTISGTYQPKTDMYTCGAYALTDGAFCLASTDAAVLSPFRIYLTVTSRLGSEESYVRPQRIGLMVDGEEWTTDAVEQPSVSNPSSLTTHPYYDLQGRRVAQPAKGIFIQGGKKVVIR